MKRVAETSEPPVVVPVVVVAVHVHVALVVVPAIEGRPLMRDIFYTTAPRILSELYRIRHHNAVISRTKYFHFLSFACVTLFQTVVENIPKVWKLGSAAENRGLLHMHLLPWIIISKNGPSPNI
jgi:hypothetical protein